MKPLYCIKCNIRTPRNFADERIFNGVYCERCAPRKSPPPPPSSGSSVQKPIDKAALWALHLAHLDAGAYGDPADPKTLLRYWEAQASAGYPGARENVQYFKDLTAKEVLKK